MKYKHSGVAVGSSIGHAIGGFFGGGGSSAASAEQGSDSSVAAGGDGQYSSSSAAYEGSQTCATDASAFTKCMNDYKGDMQVCSWYLEQLVSLFFPSIFSLVFGVGWDKGSIC